MSLHRPSAWRSALPRLPESAPYFPWLRDRGSLTARIQARGRFSLRLLRQGLARPTPDEAALLGIAPGALAWTREVALVLDGVPVVYAHTVLARQPRGPLVRWLGRIGGRSLGSLLFAHPGFARGEMRARRLDARHPLFARATATLGGAPRSLWARRSLFGFRTQAVLVTEVFSPALRRR